MITRDFFTTRRYRIGGLAFGLVGTLAVMAGIAPVSASVLSPSVHSEAVAANHSDANIVANNAVDTNNYAAGWQASPANGLASASATFTIPTITCSGNNGNQLYFGWGADSGDTQLASTIQLSCDGTTPTYTYWLITPAGLVSEPGAAAGDVVVTSIFQTATNMEAEIHDLTNGEYWVARAAEAGNSGNPYLGFNEPYATAAIQPFTQVDFTSVEVNGDYFGFENPTQFALNRGDGPLVQSSALASYGSKFAVAFVKSS
jgi:hypothetical protein